MSISRGRMSRIITWARFVQATGNWRHGQWRSVTRKSYHLPVKPEDPPGLKLPAGYTVLTSRCRTCGRRTYYQFKGDVLGDGVILKVSRFQPIWRRADEPHLQRDNAIHVRGRHLPHLQRGHLGHRCISCAARELVTPS